MVSFFYPLTALSYVILQTNETCTHKLRIYSALTLQIAKHQHHKILLIDDSELIGSKVLTLLATIPGIALLRELKLRQPHIRVIMLTNSADSFYRHKCAELKAENFLDKTKDFYRIPQLVTDCLKFPYAVREAF